MEITEKIVIFFQYCYDLFFIHYTSSLPFTFTQSLPYAYNMDIPEKRSMNIFVSMTFLSIDFFYSGDFVLFENTFKLNFTGCNI